MTFQFRIDQSAFDDNEILYLEEANASNSQYHAVHRSLDEAQDDVRRAIARLGGAIIQFIPVIFENPDRKGYLIEYVFKGGAFGQYPVAGLPIKKPTDNREEKARKQALMVASHMLDAAANAQRHMPLSNPLLLHLLADGETTIAQMIASRQELPETFLLSTPK